WRGGGSDCCSAGRGYGRAGAQAIVSPSGAGQSLPAPHGGANARAVGCGAQAATPEEPVFRACFRRGKTRIAQVACQPSPQRGSDYLLSERSRAPHAHAALILARMRLRLSRYQRTETIGGWISTSALPRSTSNGTRTLPCGASFRFSPLTLVRSARG